MKPKQHTNYFHFPKKLRRMRKYVPKSKRTDGILSNYRNIYFATNFELQFFEKMSYILKKEMVSNMLPK